MSDALWAAREGDALMHTSMLADIVGGVLEVAANVAIGALATAAVAAALGITVVTGGLGCFVLGAVVGLVVGVVMAKTGADTGLSRLCEGIGNALFPPTVQANIATGSKDTRTNGKPSARAAGVVLAPPAPMEGGAEGMPAEEPEETFLDMAKGFFSQMWRPTVATPAPNTAPADDDKVICSKHPPMPPQFLAEGSSKVMINGHPACRSGDRSTCDAVIVDAGLISDNVRIGGEPIVVREIRSGKTPGIGLAITALMMLRGRGSKFYSQFGCMLIGGIGTYLTEQVSGALTSAIAGSPNPVHSTTGAKILEGEEELDFILPALLPISWQRFYNSRDSRTDGLFGAGWSVDFEASVTIRKHHEAGEHLLFTDEQGRVIDMGAIPPGDAVFSAGEGLCVRRSINGEVLIERVDGLYRLFEPCLHDAYQLRLSQVGDRNENRIFLEYDERERLVGLRDTLEQINVCLHYCPQWPKRVGEIHRTYPDGSSEVLVSYVYDTNGDLSGVVGTDGELRRRFAYDEGRRLIEHQLPGGLRCFYDWVQSEDGWRVSRHWTDDGDEYRFDYNVPAGITQITDGLQRTTHVHWNHQYQITRYDNALGHTWTFEWDDERQLLAANDPMGGQWRYFYDESGNLLQTVDPLGRSESTVWLEHWSLPREEIDRAGNRWRYRYDQRGNCSSETDPLGNVTHYRYDAHGQVTHVIDPAGNSRHLRWNGLGMLIEETDCSGYSTRYQYDKRGHLQAITNALGQRTELQHDSRGRLSAIMHPDGRREVLTYDTAGKLASHGNCAGQHIEYRYNSRGMITQQLAANTRRQFTYDRYGRLLSLTNENGESYRFEWDDGDRLTLQRNLDGSSRRYAYDPLGNIVELAFLPSLEGPAAIIHRFEYDPGERLIAKHTDDGRHEFEYDALDQLNSVRFRDGQGKVQGLRFVFDALGRLCEEHADDTVLKHQYDSLGNPTRTCLPDGRWLNQLYYGSGHLHQINLDGRTVCDFERDRLHRETMRTQGHMVMHQDYDMTGRLRSRQCRPHTLPIRLPAPVRQDFSYDSANNLTGWLFQTPEWQQQSMLHYDGRGQVVSCQYGHQGFDEQYAYDAAGNLLNAGTQVRHDQLLNYRNTQYRYDAFGRLVEKRNPERGVQLFIYDAEHRLREVDIQSAGRTRRVRMTYDPLGRRIEKSVFDGHDQLLDQVHFTWDGLRLLQERQHARTSLYLYEDDSHEPLARVDGTGQFQRIRYYHNHINGLPELLCEEDGRSAWHAHFQLWGNSVEEWRAPDFIEDQNLRFQGQYLDRETGLHYNTFRFYDPDGARFITPDPIGLLGGFNLYQYGPNPFGWIDPLGWKKKCSFRKPRRVRSKSTGRTKAKNRNEAFAMDHVKKHPENGIEIIAAKDIGDPHFKGKGWSKMERKVNGVNIHYMAKIDRTGKMTHVTDFKYKDQ